MSSKLRSAFGHFATGVTIITASDTAGRRFGMTANSFTSLSLDPPLVLWSLAKTSSNYEAFCSASSFAVHVLDARQSQLARRFSAKDIDRFAGVPTIGGSMGVPLLLDWHARFECETHSKHDGGDHTVILGRVLTLEERPGEPLLFYRGHFGHVCPLDFVGVDAAPWQVDGTVR